MKRVVYGSILVIALGSFLSISSLSAGEGEHKYVGSKKCKMCHMKEWRSWAETKMAKSFEQLKPGQNVEAKKKAGLDPEKDYTQDETCLPCHTTGYGKSGGFSTVEVTPKLVGVGCEMCHGPGGTYTKNQYMSLKNKEYKKADLVPVGLVGEITKDRCLVCHNTKSPFVGDDYVFDFEENKEKGTHEKFPLKYQH